MGYDYIPLPKEETYMLIGQAQKGDEAAKALLVEHHTGLVKKIAMKFISEEHEFEDLVQIGYMGLLRAIEKFNPEFDVMFSTYAVPMIMGEIRRFFRDNGRIKISRALRADLYALRRMQSAFEAEQGRQPRVSEIAVAMSLTRERVLEILEADESLSGMGSLDQQPDVYFHQRVQSQSDDLQTDLIMMKEEIAALGEKQRLVILMRYYRDMTQQQIADRLGISQVQVSRLERQAIQKIRGNMMRK